MPILNFQVILVAENKTDDGTSDSVNFSAAQGIFLCYETNNLTASAAQPESGEQSNIELSRLPASYPNGEFYQLLDWALVIDRVHKGSYCAELSEPRRDSISTAGSPIEGSS